MKPYVGQIVQYRYKPDSSAAPIAAIVTVVHMPSDGKDWVALHIFTEVPRTIPHVEYAVHCSASSPPVPYVGAITAMTSDEPWPISPWKTLP